MNSFRYRLANDFQLAVLTLMGAISLVGITPFLILRAMQGEWLAFTIDLLIEAVIFGCVLRAWLAGKTHGASLFLAYSISLGTVASIHAQGAPGQYWYYPFVMACFFLVHRYHAIGMTVGSLMVVVGLGWTRGSPSEIASFFITGMVCTLLAYVFASRSEMQRQQLETLATKDALTSTNNRHTLLEELETARSLQTRENIHSGILILDLDYFKKVNDSHGHQAGDKVLVDLARLIEANIRQHDRLFRYGGEEFVILANNITEDFLSLIAEKLRSQVESHLRAPGGEVVTASIGGAMLRPEESVERWFGRADAALYHCKKNGRNQVSIDQGL